MTKKSKIWLCLVVIVALLLSISCQKSKQSEQIPVVLADVINIENALITVATKNNLWAEEGIKLTRRSFSSGKEALEAMISGQADIAVSAETPFMWATFRGEEIRIIATLNKTVVKALARRDAGVIAPGDLKGKKVASFFGTSSDFWMDELLQKNGMTRADLRLTNLKPPEMVAAITRKPPDIDVFFAWEPHIVNALKEIDEKNATIFTSENMYTEYFNLSCRKTYLDKNSQTLKKVLRVLLKAELFLKSNETQSQQIMADFLSLDLGIIKNLWTENSYKVELPNSLVNDFKREIKWALTTGMLPKSATEFVPEKVISSGILNEVKPERVEIVTQ